MPGYVTLRDLATELDIDRSNLRKYVLKNGFHPTKIRTRASQHQLTLALTVAEADTVRALRISQGFGDIQ